MLIDKLQSTLTLTIGVTSYDVPGGQIKALDFTLESYGFQGAIEFVLTDDSAHGGSLTDSLVKNFIDADIIKVKLTTQWPLIEHDSITSTETTSITGLVRDKSLVEEVYRDTSDLPILARRYRIEFADPAQVLWGQHFPCVLYTSKSVSDVLNEHKGSYITLDLKWDSLSTQKDQFFVHLPAERGVSFYDFVMWYLDAQHGLWYYDYANAKYVIDSAKDSIGTAVKPMRDDIEKIAVHIAQAPRSQPRVLNSYTEDAKTQAITQSEAVTGMYRDFLIRTSIAQDFDNRVTLETSRAVVPDYEFQLWFHRGPAERVTPGTLVTLDSTRRWSSESAIISKSWRVVRCQVALKATDNSPDANAQLDSCEMTGTFQLRLEQKDDPRFRVPPFQRPYYPGLIEGKVVSEQGEDTDKTYQIYTDADTSLETYQVKVPLWSDQKVSAPFQPEQGSGNVYIPAYRDARVLLSLDLESANIKRLLDWREGAALTMDVQGEQLYFGKNATSHTTVIHQYESDIPVFEVARLNDKDSETIRIEEGTLTIEVKENSE